LFFLIPIGHDEDEVRRLPWVTISVLLVCVVVQVFSTVATYRAAGAVVSAQEEVRAYWLEHPYLELLPELEHEARWWRLEQEWSLDGDGRPRAREIAEPGAGQKRDEQARLDRLTEDWLAARERMPTYHYGLVPASFEIGDVFASIFLHGGWLHLIGNLIFLWFTGPPLEDVWGRPRFAAFYVAAGVFGGLAWAALYPSSTAPLVGASGAIAGLMGAFMVRYAKTPVKMFYFIFWLYPFILKTGIFRVSAAFVLGFWFTRELFRAVFLGAYSGVAFAVHVAGFAFGAGVAWIIRRRRVEQKIAPKLDAKAGGDVLTNPAIEDAHELRQHGRHEEAWDVLAEELRRRPGSTDAGMALWDVGLELGRQREAAPTFLRCIRSELRQGELELGLHHWYELLEQIPETPADLELRLRLAEAMLGSQRDEDAADLLADVDSMLEASAPLGLRVRVATLAARARSASAPALCGVLLNNPEVPETTRDELRAVYSGIKTFGLRPKPDAPQPDVPAPVSAAPAAPPPPRAEAPLPLAAEAPRNRVLQVMAAVPRRLTGDKLAVDVHGQGARTLPLSRIQAVAVGRIEEGFASNYVVVDLLVDSLWIDRPTVRTVRLRSTDFDPREVLPALDGDPLQALISFIDNLIEISGANPMPDPDAARGRPFYNFVSVPDYEAKVIGFTSR
jgi:membrane associated rhomboid family serine protease/thioredoxin-like negative regulator of GroEL